MWVDNMKFIYLIIFLLLTSCATQQEIEEEKAADAQKEKRFHCSYSTPYTYCFNSLPDKPEILCRFQSWSFNKSRYPSYNPDRFSINDLKEKMKSIGLTPKKCINLVCIPSLLSEENYDLSDERAKECERKKKEVLLDLNREKKCIEFGFKKKSKEFSKCKFEIYKLEVRKKQDEELFQKIEASNEEKRRIMEEQLREQRIGNDLFILQQNLDYLNSQLK